MPKSKKTTAVKIPKTTSRVKHPAKAIVLSKKDFVLSMPDAPISTVIATAKLRGIALTGPHVSVIRSQARKAAGEPKKRGAKNAKKTKPVSNNAIPQIQARRAARSAPLDRQTDNLDRKTDDHRAFVQLAAQIGLSTAVDLIERLQSTLAAA